MIQQVNWGVLYVMKIRITVVKGEESKGKEGECQVTRRRLKIVYVGTVRKKLGVL